jgi:hypothetical protein
MLANGEAPPGKLFNIAPDRIYHWPSDLEKIIYIDHFGNAMTGIRAANLDNNHVIAVADLRLRWARTFADVAIGQGFWYGNSNGLVELAVNQGRANETLRLTIGDAVTLLAQV